MPETAKKSISFRFESIFVTLRCDSSHTVQKSELLEVVEPSNLNNSMSGIRSFGLENVFDIR